MTIGSDIQSYLAKTFPGSTIADGYHFVRFEAPASRRTDMRRVQAVIEAIGGVRWMIVVGGDPRPYAPGARFEQGTFRYEPDFNVSESYTGWFLELTGALDDFDKLLPRLVDPSAVAAIFPERNIAFQANLARVYSPSAATLDELAAQHPALFPTE